MDKLILECIFEYLDKFAKTILKEEALENIEIKFSLNKCEASSIYEMWRRDFIYDNKKVF